MNRYLKTGYICLLIAVALLAFVPIVPQLSVKNADSGRTILSHIVKPGDTFTVSYIHSVNKSKVVDSFTITDKYQIMVTSTAFSAYGAGIPEPEEGQTLTVYDDRVEITNINRIVDPYRLFVGVTADHTMKIGKEEPIHFTDIVSPQTSIIIDIYKVSIFKVIPTL